MIKCESMASDRVESNIKQEQVVRPPTTNANLSPVGGIAAETAADTGTSEEQQRDKKRKAMQDELAETELEQREVRLEQKRRRLKKALAEMNDGGN